MASTTDFELLAAIDLRGGRVVRLRQGDFGRERAYGDDPGAVARRLVGDGATWLHVVDLDGARVGRPVAVEEVRAIAAAVPATAIEIAGGLRTMSAMEGAFAIGARRVVLGTAALRDPGFAARAVERFQAGRVAIALDVRDGQAVGDAWQATSRGVPVERALERLADVGVSTFEVTSVERDGMLRGPDLALLRRLVGLGRGRIIASGGIGSLADLAAVRDIGCSGAIVGRAIYEGRFDLAAANEVIKGAET